MSPPPYHSPLILVFNYATFDCINFPTQLFTIFLYKIYTKQKKKNKNKKQRLRDELQKLLQRNKQ